MREFNNSEKAIITKLIEARVTNCISQLSVSDLFMGAASCYAIEWITEAGCEKVELYYKDDSAPRSSLFSVLDVLSLLKYLEENGYILIIQKANATQLPRQLYNQAKYKYEDYRYFQKNNTGGWVDIDRRVQVLYSTMSLLMDKYAHAIIYPTTELEMYVNRGFKTEVDVRSIKEHIATWISLIVALITGIFSIYQSTLPITIDRNQFNKIETIKNKIETRESSISNVKIINDTLDASQVQQKIL